MERFLREAHYALTRQHVLQAECKIGLILHSGLAVRRSAARRAGWGQPPDASGHGCGDPVSVRTTRPNNLRQRQLREKPSGQWTAGGEV